MHFIDPAPNYRLARWLFVRLLGLIYLAAFVSLWVQVDGLIGSNGILPATDFLNRAGPQLTGWERYHLLPTLLWFNPGDGALHLLCGGGALLAALLIVGVAPGPILALLWLFYLSLVTVSREFLSFQWDNLLLEAGFLAIWLAPWRIRPARALQPPLRPVLWTLWFLLFKLMFSSGLVKLLSGDPTWRSLTALNFHYETQPLPTPLAWYAHQLPGWFQAASVALMFVIELGVPFLIFGPRLRRWAFGPLAGLQLLILLTGNYAFFNWLAIALCVLLLDDEILHRVLPGSLTQRLQTSDVSPGQTPAVFNLYHRFFISGLAAIVLLVSAIQMAGMVLPVPAAARSVLIWLAPFRTLNNYGLFAVMTTSRPEIIIEGSSDGETWQAYEFRWKPGLLSRRPPLVAPHQPRLDWQMWFAALGDYRRNPWLIDFMFRLLEGSPQVESLLAHNPFPDAPPRFIRATVYDYHFSDFNDTSGNWWRRDVQGLYLPVLSLQEFRRGLPGEDETNESNR